MTLMCSAQSSLAPNATVYTEFSNEVWNDGFLQEHQQVRCLAGGLRCVGWGARRANAQRCYCPCPQVAAANASVTQGGDPLRLNYE